MRKSNFISQLLIIPFSLGAIALINHPGFAQTKYQGENSTTGNSPFQANEQDPTKSVLGGSLNPLQLMHQAQTGLSRDQSEFATDTQQGLSKAAAEFKKQQQKQLQLQQSGQLTQSGNNPTTSNP